MPGDEIQIAFLGQRYAFRGYEEGRGHLIFQNVVNNNYAILFNGNSGVANAAGYTASGTIVTNEPVQVGPPVVFADYGLGTAGRGTAMEQEFKTFQVGFNSDRTGPYTVGGNTLKIPSNRVYELGDIVTVTWSDGSREVDVEATFAGYEGDTSFPIFHFDEFRFADTSIFRDGTGTLVRIQLFKVFFGPHEVLAKIRLWIEINRQYAQIGVPGRIPGKVECKRCLANTAFHVDERNRNRHEVNLSYFLERIRSKWPHFAQNSQKKSICEREAVA